MTRGKSVPIVCAVCIQTCMESDPPLKMAHSDDDETLRKLFERFWRPEKPDADAIVREGSAARSDAKLNESAEDSIGAVFVARCEPRYPHSSYTSPGLSVLVSQWIRRNGREELWNSVIVRCDEEGDGTMTVRVIIANPDWEQPVQIACLRSRPGDAKSLTPLACDLNHEDIAG